MTSLRSSIHPLSSTQPKQQLGIIAATCCHPRASQLLAKHGWTRKRSLRAFSLLQDGPLLLAGVTVANRQQQPSLQSTNTLATTHCPCNPEHGTTPMPLAMGGLTWSPVHAPMQYTCMSTCQTTWKSVSYFGWVSHACKSYQWRLYCHYTDSNTLLHNFTPASWTSIPLPPAATNQLVCSVALPHLCRSQGALCTRSP